MGTTYRAAQPASCSMPVVYRESTKKSGGNFRLDPNSDFQGQVIYLDFDGAEGLTFDGPISLSGIDVPAFQAPTTLAGQEGEIIQAVVLQLEETFAGSGVLFTTDAPSGDAPFSTIYIGGDATAFSEYGSFLGLAEQVDVGNRDGSDEALVFSDWVLLDASSLTGAASGLAETVAHEVGHLLGYGHDGEHSRAESPISEVALEVQWDGGGDGTSWSDQANWSNDTLPGSGDDVVINVLGTPTVTIDASAGAVEVNSIDSYEALAITGGSLSVATTLSLADEDLSLSGGTIVGGVVESSGFGKLIVSLGSTLDGIVLDANAVLQNGQTLTVLNGLTLNGTLTLEHTNFHSATQVNFSGGAQTLSGTGQVISSATTIGDGRVRGNFLRPTDGGTLTIGSGITIHGDDMIVGDVSLRLINQGSIIADSTGSFRTIHVTGSTVTNTGVLEANGGGYCR